jgi:integrase
MDELDDPAVVPRSARRSHSPHPGVKLKPPRPANRMLYWRAVYTDPDTNKDVYIRLDPDVLSTDKLRTEWAKRKSREIAKRRIELESGAPRATGTSVAEGIRLYFDNAAHIRDATRLDYETSTNNFQKWADENGLTLDNLNRAKLIEFRAWALKLPKRRRLRGGKRGQSADLPGARRSVVTVNGDLRVVRTLLGWLHMTDRLPKLSREDMEVALARYKQPENIPEFLSSHELRELLNACARHDADTFVMTREDKRRFGERRGACHDTPRYKPISPFVLTAMLTGMRLDEVCLIEWATHVDLHAVDHSGQVVGEIRLRAQDTKTHKSRTVAFDVSPALRELFVLMHRASSGKGSVFGITYDEAQEAMQRLKAVHGAPSRANYQMLRSTCSTFLSNAPAIYGAAAPFHSSRQLGHSVDVAQKHYTGLIRGISREARSLETAMQIETEVTAVIDRVREKATITENVVSIGRARKRST